MLSFEDKKAIFTTILDRDEICYHDTFNAFIEIAGMNFDYEFLEKLNTENDIEYWINKLKSRLVMREDDAPIEDIIEDYIQCG